MKRVNFAKTAWSIKDVLSAADDVMLDMTEEQAYEWFVKHEKNFAELLIEKGNEILFSMMLNEGCK